MMTERQEPKFNTFEAADDVLTEHSSIVSGIEALDEAQDKLQENMELIEEACGRKVAAGAGTAAEKKTAKKQVATSCMRLVGLLRVEASTKGDEALAALLRPYSQSMLERTRDGRLPSVVDSIVALARTHETGLRRAGLSDDQLTAHDALTARFRELSPAPKLGRADKSLEVEKIEALFSATDKLLKERIDPMLRNLEERHPDFVKKYFAVRHIDNVGARKGDPAGVTPNA
ncbi:hypothetical protein [Flaviaesturariibacter aridisoli]|uniref:Uncharacterized protein n=1 Tax=Flaviaesturariibacter aridisoli TaxID=2545761 RepID=A0A4R4DWR6_9BACT|nr:hypothetical protein [Flaviaesturariibacter aridisoli]TCZ67311.1 hypothetical protein E0486_15820 [Flaviaesturariibacter aridisoli]